MAIPVVVALWEHASFGGCKRTIVDNENDLARQNFNDKISAIGIHAGPDYASFTAGGFVPTVSFYEHANRGGRALHLKPGVYANIHTLLTQGGISVDFGDIISSVHFNLTESIATDIPTNGPAGEIRVPLVVELFTDSKADGLGTKLVVVESERNLGAAFGSEFNDSISGLRVTPGPDYTGQETVRLYPDVDWQPERDYVEVGPGDYTTDYLSKQHFNDTVSSIYIVAP
jgi:hypothetical protein